MQLQTKDSSPVVLHCPPFRQTETGRSHAWIGALAVVTGTGVVLVTGDVSATGVVLATGGGFVVCA